MQEKHLIINYSEYSKESDLDLSDLELLMQAKEALKTAYAPYSHFAVGAALQLKSGKIVKGSNQENAAFPSGMCAERVAVFAASANFPKEEILAIAVYSIAKLEDPITPCGACLQVLNEYELKQVAPIRLLLNNQSGKSWVFNSISDLLPFGFHKMK